MDCGYRKKKRRRGVAIEFAIAFMAVAFALCSIIIIISYSVRVRDQIVTEAANDNFILDQLGEHFVSAIRDSNKATSKNVKTVETLDFRQLVGQLNAQTPVTEADLAYAKLINQYEIQYFSDLDSEETRKYTPEDYSWLKKLFGMSEYEVTRTMVHTMKVWEKDALSEWKGKDGATYTFFDAEDRPIDRVDTGANAVAKYRSDNLQAYADVKPVLIVSVQEVNVERGNASTSTYRILNWSDQENVVDRNYNSGKLQPKSNWYSWLWWLLLLPVIILTLAIIVIVL